MSSESGFVLLELLAAEGWSVAITAAPAGVRVRATRRDWIVTREGVDVASVARLVYEATRR